MYVKNDIKTVTDDREYYLNLPHLVVGSLETFNTIKPIYSNGIMELKEIEYNQCLVKQIEEAIQNACDEFTRTKGDYANKIDIKIASNGYITVSDNGRGIPLESYVASATNFKTGSNFTWLNEEAKDNNNIGAHGIGSKLITLFSTDYKMVTITDKGKGVLECKNNMSSIKHSETTSITSTNLGTTITWLPDYERMKLASISQDLLNHIYMLLLNMAISFPKIQFIFNGKSIKIDNFKEYMQHISPDKYSILVDTEDVCLAVYPTEEPKFVHVVNSIDINKGGVALNYITNNIVTKFTEKLKRSYSKITNTAIKNRLGIALILRNMKNLKFGAGQTKEELKNTLTELKLPIFNYTQFAEILSKNNHIKLPIIELYKIQQELENRSKLSSMKTISIKRVDKFFPATKEKKYCYLAEGESAKGLLMNLNKGITRINCSFYSLLGKPLNVMNASNSQVSSNKVIKDLVSIFGVALGNDDISNFSHENIVIASDSDADGMGPITGGLIMFFVKYYPELVKQGRLKKLYLPLMIAYKGTKIIEYFRDFSSYQEWCSNNDVSEYKIEYYKGLGGFDTETIEELFDIYGFESFIDTIEWDEDTEEILKNWLHRDCVEFRKHALTADDACFNIGIV